jgi:hypothetical protein
MSAITVAIAFGAGDYSCTFAEASTQSSMYILNNLTDEMEPIGHLQ